MFLRVLYVSQSFVCISEFCMYLRVLYVSQSSYVSQSFYVSQSYVHTSEKKTINISLYNIS